MQALVKYLDNVSDEDIPSLEIPTGVPLIYELDDNLKPIRHYYVGYAALLLNTQFKTHLLKHPYLHYGKQICIAMLQPSTVIMDNFRECGV